MSDPKSRVMDACRRRIAQGMPPAMAEAIIRLLRPSIRLLPEPTREAPVGRSRIGGLPDLPEGTPWPVYPGPPKPDAAWEALRGEPLAFLLQVNLGEVAPCDAAGLLPASGLLSFFYLETNRRFGRSPVHGEIARVLYSPPKEAGLHRTPPPGNLPPGEVYRGFPLSGHLEWTVPRWGDLEEVLEREGGLTPEEIDAGLEDHWDELVEEVAGLQGLGPWHRPRHRVLGYPDFIQADGCGRDDWQLLLQVDSDPRFSSPSPYDDPGYPGPGMMWGDSGRIFFGIDRKDLKAKNFAGVWAYLECH